MSGPMTAAQYAHCAAPHPMQDVAGQWLNYAQAEAKMAARLVAVGFEKAAGAHCLIGAECMQRAARAADFRVDDGSELVAGLEEHRLDAEDRMAYSEKLLAR
jgi:hypothetical protein